jgi:hypothetical protein
LGESDGGLNEGHGRRSRIVGRAAHSEATERSLKRVQHQDFTAMPGPTMTFHPGDPKRYPQRSHGLFHDSMRPNDNGLT